MERGTDDEQIKIGDSQIDVVEVDKSLSSRIGFIQKVYSILSIQLFYTAAFTILSVSQPAMREFEATQVWLLVLAAIIAIVIICTLFCYPINARKVPKNYIYLFLFTICEGYVVSAICCIVAIEYQNGIDLIFIALSMTVLMTFGLTLYACTTKQDFTICGGLLWSLVICLFLLIIFSWFFPSRLLQIIISVFAIFLYSLYIIIDTQLIVGDSKRHSLRKDDYILGAIILYIDIIMLFLELLKLLAVLSGKK